MGIHISQCDPATRRKALEMAGVKDGGKKPRRLKVALVVADECSTATGGVWVIPVEVQSLANERTWQVRNRVSQRHRKAVSRHLGPTLAWLAPVATRVHRDGCAVRCLLTRLGGRPLDRAANLPASLKYIEDGVVFFLGLDDADPRWMCSFGQLPGGPCGVRIEIEVVG